MASSWKSHAHFSWGHFTRLNSLSHQTNLPAVYLPRLVTLYLLLFITAVSPQIRALYHVPWILDAELDKALKICCHILKKFMAVTQVKLCWIKLKKITKIMVSILIELTMRRNILNLYVLVSIIKNLIYFV